MRSQVRKRWKWVCYVLLILLCYLLQTVPRFLTFGSAKPIWLIAVCCVIGMFEQPLPAGVFGMIAGLFFDLATGGLFGLGGALMLLLGTGVSLLFSFWLRQRFLTSLLVTAAASLITLLLNYLINYTAQGNGTVTGLLLQLPTALLTAVTMVVLYPIVHALATRLSKD